MSSKLDYKKEIHYLLSKVIDRFEKESGQLIVKNSNRKNYEPIAILLSEISKDLPNNYAKWGSDPYAPDLNPQKPDYPFRKYDITGNQVKDAFFNQIVSKPRPYMVDACYIYLYGKAKKRFIQEPEDEELLEILSAKPGNEEVGFSGSFSKKRKRIRSESKWLWTAVIILFLNCILFSYLWYKQKMQWDIVTSDLSIMPYQPTSDEIKKMEGIWLCYTGSPQARPSDPERFHKVVPNLIEVKYKNGYFTYNRFGASFNHAGYLQFEAPNLVSIHTFVKNQNGKIESPRHSLLSLNEKDSVYNAISASWNFDIGDRNRIIGIREVYIKQGSGGKLNEIINSLENANCKCKIIEWNKTDSSRHKFYLKNILLDSLHDPNLLALINEKSILTRNPEDSILISFK